MVLFTYVIRKRNDWRQASFTSYIAVCILPYWLLHNTMGSIHFWNRIFLYLHPWIPFTILNLRQHSTYYGYYIKSICKFINILTALLTFRSPLTRSADGNLHKHGLRTPNEAFFHRNPKLLGLGRQFGQISFGVFSADLSATILLLWVPCPCFPLSNHYFYKK